MNKLIIITGVSGTGKSSLGTEIHKKLENSIFLSLDSVMENIYDLLGFKNREEKDSLKLLGKNMYKQLIKEAIKRKEQIIIIEYPGSMSSIWTQYRGNSFNLLIQYFSL